jgi:DNA primase
MYGRNIDDTAKTKHLYLKGKHRSVFNRKASKVYDEIILTESIIDALSLNEMGIENVQAIYGTNGFTEEHLQILKDDRVKTVVLAFDADEPGRSAAAKMGERLQAEGFSVKTIQPPSVPNLFPERPEAVAKDWNEYLCAGGDPQAVKEAIAKAEVHQLQEAPASSLAAEKTPFGYDFTLNEVTYSISGVK